MTGDFAWPPQEWDGTLTHDDWWLLTKRPAPITDLQAVLIHAVDLARALPTADVSSRALVADYLAQVERAVAQPTCEGAKT